MKCQVCGGEVETTAGERYVNYNDETVRLPITYFKCLKKGCGVRIITKEEIRKCKDDFYRHYREHVYKKYRGKCKEFSVKLVERDSSLRLVRGYYYCPMIQEEEMHWWCENERGEIIDPTAKQFWSEGSGTYREFNGFFKCRACGKDILETKKDKIVSGRHIYCNDQCYKEIIACE